MQIHKLHTFLEDLNFYLSYIIHFEKFENYFEFLYKVKFLQDNVVMYSEINIGIVNKFVKIK